MRFAFVFVFLFTLTGCPVSGAVSDPVLQKAESVNSDMVTALKELQETTRQARKEALKVIAETAPSVAEGKARMDALDARHRELIELLEKAESVQNVLADLLELGAGGLDIDKIIKTYSDLQALYGDIARESSTWTLPQ